MNLSLTLSAEISLIGMATSMSFLQLAVILNSFNDFFFYQFV